MTCIYCRGRRGDPEQSLEHIWPRALGGADSPSLFQTDDVCRSCNSVVGQWVDGAFLKSWFITHEIGESSRSFIDPQKPGPLPLMYMGVDQRFPVEQGEVAELWMGQGGESVHHVHQIDSPTWFGFAGGDFIRRKRLDPGRAYLMIRSQNQYWAWTSLLSFIEYMRGARLFSATRLAGVPSAIAQQLTDEGKANDVEQAELGLDLKPCKQRAPSTTRHPDGFLSAISGEIGRRLRAYLIRRSV